MNWYKKAQFTEENTVNSQSPSIIIEPFEPLVQEATEEIKRDSPNFFQGVNKIKIDLGFGQFGSVSSDNPSDINLNYNKIKNEVMKRIDEAFDINNLNHKDVLKEAIKETIIHEKGHVSDAWTSHSQDPESNLQGADLFPGGETAAENFVRQNYR
jgi:hypothetical protein